MNKLVIISVLVLLIIAGCTSCSQPELAAEWHDIQITLPDFERSYFNNWQINQEPDSPKFRKIFVRKLIEQQIIAQTDKSSEQPDNSTLEKAIKSEKEYFLRRRYLEKTIKDTITEISEDEINLALKRSNKKMRVRQLYAQDEAGIRELEKRHNSGERFEDIARQTMPDPVIAAREGDLGWIGWGDTDLPVENVVYQLKRGEVSAPVQSLMGWHIFRIDSIRINIDFGSNHDPVAKKEITQKLFNRKLDMASAHHYRELLWSKPLAMKVKLFKDIWDFMEPLLPKNSQEKALKGFGQLEVNLELDFSKQAIAFVDDQPFTIGEFIAAVPSLPRDLLRPNLKKAVEVAVRDKIVVQEALKKGLDSDPVVQEKINRLKTKYTYYAALAKADSTARRKVNLKEFYEEYKHRYIDRIESEIEAILVKDRELALKVARQLSEGADFSRLYKTYSTTSSSSNGRGYLGFVSSKNNPIGRKAADLHKGAVYAPIKTNDGFYVIRVGGQKKYYLQFDDVKNKVASDAQKEYYNILHRNLLPKDYIPTDIIYYPENLNKALTNKSNTIF